MYLNQFIGPQGDWVSWIVWIIFFMVFFMFYPRLMVSQMMWKLEGSARKLEELSKQSKKFILAEISDNPSQATRDSIDRFFEFFLIEPVSLDPFGVIKKLDHIIKNEKDRFDYFVAQVAPKLSEDKKAAIQMGIAGGIELHMVAKIVRHYVEMVKKTKSYQIAMIIQMQLPLIEIIAKALFKGTKTLAKGEPIGDGIGPWMVASMIEGKKAKELEGDMVVAQKRMHGRQVFLMKARGPGGRTGFPGKAFEKIMSRNTISKVITIDAAAKLEGEETGSIAEGIGVALGGPGVERSYIEDAVVKHEIPIDSIIVKMSSEEAIQPLRKKMLKAQPRVEESIKRSIETARRKGKIIIIGVGNTSGVGNSKADADKTALFVEEYEKKVKAKKKKGSD